MAATVRRDDPPLASYVLRVRGRPATLRYELHDLRSGSSHVFRQADEVAEFLRRHGLDGAEGGSTAPTAPPDA